jgi:hypothetical protein
MSLASAALSVYSDLLKGQTTATADNWNAEKLDTAATYGELKGVQVGGQAFSAASTGDASRPRRLPACLDL